MSMDPAHRDHDEWLIVRAAGEDAGTFDRTQADRQLAVCPDCRQLLADVQAIRASTVATVLRVPPRPHSFRIPVEELERMRVPRWRRWLEGFGAPRFDFVRPLGTVVAGLGLAVAVLGGSGTAALPLGQPALAPGAASDFSGNPANPASSPAAATPASDRNAGAPSAGEKGAYGGGVASPVPAPGASASPAASPSPAAVAASPEGGAPSAPVLQTVHAEAGPSLVTLVGVVLFAAGLAVILLNLAARRLATH